MPADPDRHARACRDALFLAVFAGFWAGMLFVAAAAVERGDPKRLIYGVDSDGYTCGANNKEGPDLRERKKLYFIDPTDIDAASVSALLRAKRVCSAACPGKAAYCPHSALVQASCSRNEQHVCPYYRNSPMWGHLSALANDTDRARWRTDYFAELRSATRCPAKLPAAVAPFVEAATATVGYSCGVAWQYMSHIPGQGPCYPVLAPTVDLLNKCVPDVAALASPAPPQSTTTTTTVRRRHLLQGTVMDAADVPPDTITTTATQTTTGLGSESNPSTTIPVPPASGMQQAVTAVSSVDINAYLDRLKKAIDNLDRLQAYTADAGKGINIVVVTGVIGGVVFSVLWMTLLRFCAGIIIWGTLVLINLSLLGVSLFCAAKGGLLPDKAMEVGGSISADAKAAADPAEQDREVFVNLTYVTGAIAGLALLFTLVLASRIRVAIATLKVAAQAIAAMPNVLLYPLLPFVLYVGLVVYWVIILGFLFTAGTLTETRDSIPPPGDDGIATVGNITYVYDTTANPVRLTHYHYTFDNATRYNVTSCAEDPACYYGYHWDTDLQYMGLYHLFGLLWTTQFLEGVSFVTLAGALSSFYWSSGDASQMPRQPLLDSMYRCVRYHLGSVALGSFIVALVQFVRLALEYIDRKSKELQDGNFIVRYCMSCLKCYMACLECVLKFINRNAYIIVAIDGASYCSAAATAVKLLVANAVTLVAVNTAGDGLIAIGRLVIVAATALCALSMSGDDMYTDPRSENYLQSPIVPVLLACVASYVIASQFLSVFEMAVDTMLLCFCRDCDQNGGNPSSAPPLLLLAIGKARKANSKVNPSGKGGK